MLPLFDILRVESDGQLLWQGTVETLALARLRIQVLRVAKPSDYVIFSPQTGHKIIGRQDDSQGDYPVCPKHEILMVPHFFQSWEPSLAQGTLDCFY